MKDKLQSTAVKLFSGYILLSAVLLSLPAVLYGQADKTLNTPTSGEVYASNSITLLPGFSTTGDFRAYIRAMGNPIPAVPAQDRAYIITRIIKVAGKTSPEQLEGLSADEMQQSIAYFDGLGRVNQVVQSQASPDYKDIVQPMAYDSFGRQVKNYLPFTATTNNGGFVDNAIDAQSAFYANAPAGVTPISGGLTYSESRFENSPLSRLLEQGAPGWHFQVGGGHTQTAEHGANTAGEVKLWVINGNGAASTSSYGAGTLSKLTAKDENGNKTITFSDNEGHVVLKQTESDGGMLSTYYVYDDMGHLRYVLPPAVSGTSFTESDAIFGQFIYAYRYDGRGQVVEKKIPGKGWEYFVYNKAGRVVMSQDARQRDKANQEWLVARFDILGRPVSTAAYVHVGSVANENKRTYFQAKVDAQTQEAEERTSAGSGYTLNCFPTAGDTELSLSSTLSLNYYDDYNFPGNTFGGPAAGDNAHVHGLPVASKTAVLGSSQMLLSVMYYDHKGRVILTKNENHIGGSDIAKNAYNFIGGLDSTSRTHTRTGTPAQITIKNRYEYDHMGRRTTTYQRINGDGEVTLSAMGYNALGQLWQKKIHKEPNSSSFMQTTFYAYNTRGWLKSMIAEKFAMELKYEDGTVPQFNGNISGQFWGTQANPSEHNYQYTYDKLNRLTGAISDENFNESLSYDAMGNIITLARNPMGVNNYTYDGNRLSSISGFVSGAYTYDVNGNLKQDGTKNLVFTYNSLNLPQEITGNNEQMLNTWTASGLKLRKTVGGLVRDYAGGIEYNNGAIDFIQTEEGRAIPGSSGFTYEYALKDHLGNVRVLLDQNGTVLEKSDYYAFGLQVTRAGQTVPSPENRYKFNGKELQTELGLMQYDYGARFYDPVIGRWSSVDPLAEMGRRWSPYNYALNNPIRYIDPDGMYSTEEWKKDNGITDDDLIDIYKASTEEPDSREESEYEEEEAIGAPGGVWTPLYKSTLLNYVKKTICPECGTGALQNKTGAVFEDLFEEFVDDNFTMDNFRVIKNPLNNKLQGEVDYTVPDFLGLSYTLGQKAGPRLYTFYEIESFYELKATKNNIGVGAFDGQLKVQVQAAKRAKVKEIVFVTTYGVKLSQQLKRYAQSNGVAVTHYWATYRMEAGIMKTNYTPASK